MQEAEMGISMGFASSFATWYELRGTMFRVFTTRTNQQWRSAVRHSYVALRSRSMVQQFSGNAYTDNNDSVFEGNVSTRIKKMYLLHRNSNLNCIGVFFLNKHLKLVDTHTHTHIYIYIYVCVCVCVCVYVTPKDRKCSMSSKNDHNALWH